MDLYSIYTALEAFFAPYYEPLRALHIIAVISWMAGLLYLPRLFVYHTEEASSKEMKSTFSKMEFKLMNYIMHPAMVVTWISGVALLLSLQGSDIHIWMLIKISAAIVMTIFHFILAKYVIDFSNNKNVHSGKYYRIINEIPTVLMILIVVMAVIEPFGKILFWENT